MATAASKTAAIGFIRADELYTVRELRRRLDLPPAAWTEMNARGFPTIKDGKRVFISGRKAIEYFEQVASKVEPCRECS